MAIDKEHAARVQASMEQSKQQLREQEQPQAQEPSNTDIASKVNIPKKAPSEKKKNFTFSLLPSVRANIEKIAKENNYNSSSELLNTMFKE
ncbi:CopG family transcriptional regulator [Mammaliicoccus lentus]|uniref:CopG family transcriptional regulator n=1 Tax=Mammaliicoccus lentus TaxID=42858 RepID=UPI001071CB8D|nr:CopG family transcriptional regulator [Mammaliicoccus lentus]MBF0795248.1 CopG family transcriptional regulator [Mammaliicoccus lentus]TFV14644.1 CopG family transcriptional regulator [Mammaliicoccus lentus]